MSTAGEGSFLRRKWDAWWTARLPRTDHLSLSHRNLYILPSKAGWWFTLLLVLLLVASINEKINLGYALTFWLVACGLVTAYFTHANAQGLKLHFLGARSVHAGDAAVITVGLENSHAKQSRWGLTLETQDGGPQPFELKPAETIHLEVAIATQARGWMSLPRLTLYTQYPLGLFHTWAYWRPASKVLVWPALERNAPPLTFQLSANGGQAHPNQRSHHEEAPEGLREYRQGDPLRWIAWKKSTHAIASGAGLVSRTPELAQSAEVWLDYQHTPGLQGLAPEAKLSRLASWLWQLEHQAEVGASAYGLKLPGITLTCGRGAAHWRQCMDTLALWGQDTPTQPQHKP